MNTRGRVLSGLATMVIALAGFLTAGTLPAAAAPSTIAYVALGDSYAAGTANQLGGCPHGPDPYPVVLAGSDESRIDLKAFAACSGWRTSDVVKVVDSQPSPLDRNTRLVTLTVGAADLGLSRVLAACVPISDRCLPAIHDAQEMLGVCGGVSPLGDLLVDLYDKVAKAAPGARIVVTGYPLLFDSPAAGSPRAAINDATTKLNCVIKQAVADSQATYANIYYVDVTEEFKDQGLVNPNNPSDFIHGLFTCDPPRPTCADPEAFHPTALGYAAYAKAISAALPPGWLDKSSN